MQIETTRFGILDVEEEVVIHFPWGIPGFEQLKRFILMQHRQGPFQWLQAADDPAVAFVVCPPETFGVSYRVPADPKQAIGLDQQEDLVILIMVSFDRAQAAACPHLRGPLLFNAASRQALQWTLDSNELSRYIKCLNN